MACWLPTQDARFKAAVAFSPVTNWYSERYGSNLGAWVGDFLDGEPTARRAGSTTTAARCCSPSADRTPTLLTAGLLDRATPPDQAIEFHNALVEQGVASDVVIYPGEGHGVHYLPRRDRLHDAHRGVVRAPHARTRLAPCLAARYEHTFAMLPAWRRPKARCAGRSPVPSSRDRCWTTTSTPRANCARSSTCTSARARSSARCRAPRACPSATRSTRTGAVATPAPTASRGRRTSTSG